MKNVKFYQKKRVSGGGNGIKKMSSSRNADAIAEVFYRYDPEHTGKITREKLRSAIFDLNGRQIDDDELGHIYELFEGKDDTVTLENFIKVNEQFFKYC